MADLIICENQTLVDIADAIRSKTDETDSLSIYEMANTIGNLEVGDSFADIAAGRLTSYASEEITDIKAYLFYNARNLQTISLPNATTMREYAFSGCAELENINLPNVINMYGQEPFNGCSKLIEISLPNLQATYIYGFRNSSAQKVYLKNCLTIDEYTFYTCGKIEYLYIPKVTTIKGSAFSGCSNLATIIIEQTDSICALSSTSAFSNTPIASGTGYVYVADSMVDSYKIADNWSTYASQIKPLSEYAG